MDKPTCKTCPYWDDSEGDTSGTHEGEAIGYCQRYPQELMTHNFQTCGEHPDFPEWIAEQRKEKTSGK